MKNFKIIALLLGFSFLLNSCEKDEEVLKDTPKNYLAGTWLVAKVGELNANNAIQYSDYVNEGDCGVDSFTFGENTDFTFVDYYLNGSSACENETILGNYSRSGSNVAVEYVDEFNVTQKANLSVTSLTYDTMDINFVSNGDTVFFKLKKQ